MERDEKGNGCYGAVFEMLLEVEITYLALFTGIHLFYSHMLRHYFAQSGLDAGWKLPMIANALGHKDTRTTELYLRIPAHWLKFFHRFISYKLE